MQFPRSNKEADEPPVDIFAQNIQTVAELVARREARLSRGQRFIEGLTEAIGRPRFLYINVLFIAAWVLVNSHFGGRAPFDEPPFFWLATILAVESTLVTGMVLISQNRQRYEAERRAQLDLQINLLSEQKISKILSVLEELAQAQDLEHQHDPEITSMKQTADPEILLTALEFAMDQAASDPTPVAELSKEQADEIQDVESALRVAHQEVTAARGDGEDAEA